MPSHSSTSYKNINIQSQKQIEQIQLLKLFNLCIVTSAEVDASNVGLAVHYDLEWSSIQKSQLLL